MALEEVFPRDPFEPTVEYIGLNQTPFAMPWAKGRVQLCDGFNTKRGQNDPLFMQRSAFRDTKNTPLQYRQCQSTFIRDESGTQIATASGSTTFAISASVGGSFLGASGRGSYEKSTRDSKNISSIKVSAQHTCGQIDVVRLPELSPGGVRILKDSSNPVDEFHRTYGDFYVAGYRIGAVNSTSVSGDLANKVYFEAKRAELDAKVLLVPVHHSINEVSQSGSDVGALSVDAFDSLEGIYKKLTATREQDGIEIGDIATINKQRAMTIAGRASSILEKDFSLVHEGTLEQDCVDRLCDRGLVTELLLAPFSSLREYRSLLSLRHSRPG